VGINNDSTENHRQIAKSVNIAFALASDPTLEVCRNYRALWLNGLAIRRITYIIDKRGIVRGMAHHELLVQQHWNHVVRTLQELNEDEQIRTFNRKAWNL
jgi:peroxiredoxin